MKAVIFDLDGTAMPNVANGMPSERLIKAVQRLQSQLMLCAATGRPITNGGSILTALGLKDPCVISAGTQIVNPVTKEILWEAAMNQTDVQRIIEICQPYHYEILMNQELTGEGARASEHKLPERVNVMYIMKVGSQHAEKIMRQLHDIPDITASAVTSWTLQDEDIHITHKEATKEHAVAELLKLLNLSKQDVVGVGDADNDIHLFEAVGYKVAMGNATEKLKSRADEVIETVDNDGLASFLEGLIH